MMPLCFREVYESKAVGVRELLGLAALGFGEEAVHDLRVEIKRLRAFFDLVEDCNRLFCGRDQFKPIRVLFKAAGSLREVQVDLSLAKAKSAALHLDLDEYRNELKGEELRARRKFAAAAADFEPGLFLEREEAISRALAGLDLPFLQSRTEAFFEKLVADLRRLKQPGGDRTTLHKIRIQTKKTRYVLEVLQKCFRPDEARLKDLNDSLRAVHQALGQWHDLQLGLASARVFLDEKAARPLTHEDSYTAYVQALQADSDRNLGDFEKAWEGMAGWARVEPGGQPL